jgi:hypothetical protein
MSPRSETLLEYENVPAELREAYLQDPTAYNIELNGEIWSTKPCTRKYVFPESRERLFADYHDSLLGGHLNFEQTWSKIKRNYYWPKMFNDIKTYVTNCSQCQ